MTERWSKRNLYLICHAMTCTFIYNYLTLTLPCYHNRIRGRVTSHSLGCKPHITCGNQPASRSVTSQQSHDISTWNNQIVVCPPSLTLRSLGRALFPQLVTSFMHISCECLNCMRRCSCFIGYILFKYNIYIFIYSWHTSFLSVMVFLLCYLMTYY